VSCTEWEDYGLDAMGELGKREREGGLVRTVLPGLVVCRKRGSLGGFRGEHGRRARCTVLSNLIVTLCEAEAPIHCAQTGFSRRIADHVAPKHCSSYVFGLDTMKFDTAITALSSVIVCRKHGMLGGFRGELGRRARSTDAIEQGASVSARAIQSSPYILLR